MSNNKFYSNIKAAINSDTGKLLLTAFAISGIIGLIATGLASLPAMILSGIACGAAGYAYGRFYAIPRLSTSSQKFMGVLLVVLAVTATVLTDGGIGCFLFSYGSGALAYGYGYSKGIQSYFNKFGIRRSYSY